MNPLRLITEPYFNFLNPRRIFFKGNFSFIKGGLFLETIIGHMNQELLIRYLFPAAILMIR